MNHCFCNVVVVMLVVLVFALSAIPLRPLALLFLSLYSSSFLNPPFLPSRRVTTIHHSLPTPSQVLIPIPSHPDPMLFF
ncbi:MAG: hypothetical protein J3R72DRAFT_434003 [Linnemannia gamsii]|nr:MAG: hypothetical protein J3R72DRAFT_434003 [Linnemannia gamsii]